MTTAFTRIARRFIVPATGARSDRLRLVFDIEANGLLGAATTVWCIVIIDLDSGQIYEYGPGQISAALAHLARADVLIGHNITGYDLPLLDRLHHWRPKADRVILDTLVAGRLILPHIADLDDQAAAMGDAKLGKLRGSYKLEAWGVRLGIPKVGADIIDFSVHTPELQARCVGDSALTKALLHFLQPDGYSQQALEHEHCVVAICDQIKSDGVPFDTVEADQLYRRWLARRTEREAELRQQFPSVKNWNSRKQIITLLQSRGWTPKKFTDKGNPSLDEDVLATVARIYPEFVGLSEYFALGVLIGKIITGPKSCRNNVAPDGRIHNAPIHIRTPHSRAQYSDPNLGGIPNPKKGKPFGSECRTLFRHPGDWVFVTCDQANLQDRAFAHHLTEFDGGAYGKDFLAGVDKHWQNANALELVSAGTERDKESKLHTAIREGAKHFHYGVLFGAQNPRCGEILTETVRTVGNIDPTYTAPTDGKRARDRFIAATPGLQRLKNKLEAQVARHGWLPGLDGRRIPCRAQYTALNYALASIEAIVCKRWLINVHDELCARFKYGWGGDAVIVLWVHDEIAVCCRPEVAEQVGEILVRYAKEAGTHYQLKVPLDAEYKIGRSWAGEPVEAGAEPVAPKTAPESTPATITIDEGLQVSAGAEPMAPQLAPVMPEKISTAPEMSALTSSAPVGPTSEIASTDAEPVAPEPAGVLDADGDPLGAAAGVAVRLAGAVAAAVGSVPGTLTAAPGAEEAQPSKPNGASAPVSSASSAAGNGRDRDADGNYGDRSSEQQAGKPYGVTRTMLMARGYRVTQTFPFQVPSEVEPRFFEDRWELKPGITASKERPRKTCRYWHRTNEQELNDTGPRRIIYNWPAIMAAGPGANVFITEGANKSKPLNEKGLLATAAPYHQWGPECVAALAGQHLFYLEDSDHPDEHGHIKAKELATAARKKLTPAATSFRIVPGLHLWKNLGRAGEPPHGWDVKDWIEQGGDPAKLLDICREVPADAEAALELDEWDAGELLNSGLPEPRQWLEGRQFCRRFLSGLVASGDVGKTTLRLTQAIGLATGRELIGHRIYRRCRVLVVSFEDDRAELHRRLLAVCRHHGVDPAELKGWLFCRELNGVKLAQQDKGQYQLGPLDGMLRRAIERLRLDLIVLDPFVKLHTLDENKNPDMDFVCTQLIKLAQDYNIAVDSPAHTHKGQIQAGDADARRGASAQRDAGRLDFTLTPMSEEEAKRFGIDPDERKGYVRLDRAKANLVRATKAEWFKLVSVALDNATEDYPEGDEIQAIETWAPPEIWEGISVETLNAILNSIEAGMGDGNRFSDARSAKERAAWRVVVEHAADKTEAQAREIIRAWVKNGVLISRSYWSPTTSKEVNGLYVNPIKRPA